MKRVISFVVVCTVAIALLAGCNAQNAAPQELDQLRKVTLLLDWYPNTNHTGLYVAKDKGYYEEEGLDVTIVQQSAGGTAQAIGAGQGEFGISYQEEVTYARTAEAPIPVKAIAAIIQHNTSGFAAPADKDINSPKDFEGKKYGGWGSEAEKAMLRALMEKDGGDFNKLQMVDVGDMDFFAGVQTSFDFMWIYYGWDGVAAELRDFEIDFIKPQDIDNNLDFYTPVIIASEEMLDSDPDLVSKFMSATAKGYEYAIANPEEAVESLLKDVPEMDRDLATASQKYLANEYKADAPRWGEMKLNVWENYASFMHQNGLISKPLDANEAFTNEYLPEK